MSINKGSVVFTSDGSRPIWGEVTHISPNGKFASVRKRCRRSKSGSVVKGYLLQDLVRVEGEGLKKLRRLLTRSGNNLQK